jgi:hypothetical protein
VATAGLAAWHFVLAELLTLSLLKPPPNAYRIPDDTIALVRELARLMPDRQIARLLNRTRVETGHGKPAGAVAAAGALRSRARAPTVRRRRPGKPAGRRRAGAPLDDVVVLAGTLVRQQPVDAHNHDPDAV